MRHLLPTVAHGRAAGSGVPTFLTLVLNRMSSLLLVCVLIGIPTTLCAGDLHDAVRAEDKAEIERLLANNADVNETDFIFGTALHVAVSEGNLEIAKTLIDNGADVEAVSEQQGSRALHLAAQFGDSAMLELLLDSGAGIEERDHLGRTPLLRVANAGNVAATRLLIDRGADIHAREGKFGWTPLHEASHHGHVEVVKVLLDHGADIHATSNSGRTAFRLAATPPSYLGVGDASLLEYLVTKGADPNAKDTSGISALAYASSGTRGQELLWQQIVEMLRYVGASE